MITSIKQRWKSHQEYRAFRKMEIARLKRIQKLVPRYCQMCEVLGICRDEHNDWKCRNGCLELN